MKKTISVLLAAVLLTVSLSSCSGLSYVFKHIFDKYANSNDISSEYSYEGIPEDNVKSVNLSQTEVYLNVGDAIVIYADILPEDFNVDYLNWTSSDDSIAYVQNGNTENGTIVAASTGKTVITVMAPNGVCGYCNVTVSDKEVESLALDNYAITLTAGETYKINAVIEPYDAATSYNWYSYDESIVMVNSEGLITGISQGVTNVTCLLPNGMEATCTVTVKAKANTSQSGYYPPEQDKEAVFPESSIRYLSQYEVAGISSSQAQTAINEIYARHGYVFNSDRLYQYYSSKPWYSPNPYFSEKDFSDIENYNLNLIKKYRD